MAAALLLAWLAWTSSESTQPNDLRGQSVQPFSRNEAKRDAIRLAAGGSRAASGEQGFLFNRVVRNSGGWTAVYSTSESQSHDKAATKICVDLDKQGKSLRKSAAYGCP